MASSAATGTQAIDRAAALVAAVVRADQPLAFLDLVEGCGLPRSTTSRLLSSLERTELVERNDEGSYVAGSLFWLYATRHDPWDELVRIAWPVLEEIGLETRETVNLSVARGDRVVQVAQIDSDYLLGTRDWTEIDVPAHCSALGRVMLAYGVLTVPPGRLDRLTEHTVTSRESLQRNLAATLGRGWAATCDELEMGLAGVAVPVRGADGNVIAALGVSGPTARLDDERQRAMGPWLNERAEQLTRLLRGGETKEGMAV